MSRVQIRAMIQNWPVSRLLFHIAGARQTIRGVSVGLAGSVPACARHIAIMRAELARREAA